jgi:transposase
MARHSNKFDEVRRYVAGVDLAGNADHYVCGPRKDDGTHDIERFGTTTNELLRMVAWMKEHKVVSAAMESTSVYWIPVYDTLEAAGIEVVLVDTRTVKMVPGRKSDVKDCQWLQRLHSCGLLRGAFRPPEAFNAVRSVIREKGNVLQMRSQSILSIQKALDQMNIRLHHAVSDIDGVTGMKILGAIVAGERNPRKLATLRDRRCKKSETEIAEELTGNWREEHLFNLKQAYETLCFLDGRIADYDTQIRAMYAKIAEAFPPVDPPPDGTGPKKQKDKEDSKAKADIARICGGFDMTKIDGIGYDNAAAILSELGPRLDAFPAESNFVSYIGVAPALGKSAGKNVSSRKKHKNTSRVGIVLKMAASTLSRSESSLGARYRCVRSRTCSRTAIKDVAREMAKRIYRGIKYGQAYVDEGERAYMERTRERTIKSMKKKISKLGISAEELGIFAVAV